MVTHFADDLANLEGLFFDQLRTLESLRAELLQLHQLRVGEYHTDPVVQVMQPLSDAIFVHSCFNLTRRLLFQVERVLHDLVGHGNDLRIRLVTTLKSDDLCQFAGQVDVRRLQCAAGQQASAALPRNSQEACT